MLDFPSDSGPQDPPVYNVEDIPKEFDIFWRTQEQFLPPGKTVDDLTPEEMAIFQSQYRFDPLRPGMYQTLSGMSGSGRGGM